MATKRWIGNDTGHEGDVNTAANWSPSGVPEAGDTVYFDENGVEDVDTNLATFAAVVFAAVHVTQACTVTIGTATAYLQLGSCPVHIGYQAGSTSLAGSPRVMIDTGSSAATVTVYNTSSSPTETNLPAVRILAGHASSVLTVLKGSVGLAATAPGETSTAGTVNVAYTTSVDTDAQVVIGAGVTLTTLNQSGGTNTLRCAATTVTQSGGTLTTQGSGAITTWTITGGTAYPESTGTITTLAANGGIVNLLRCPLARTVTTLSAAAGSTAQISYDPAVLTVTNKLTPAGRVQIQLLAA